MEMATDASQALDRSFYMKKHAILFGFIFAVLALASCKFEKGGTIEVKNDSNYKASIHIEDGSMMPVDGGAKQEAAAGKTVMFSISEDGAYTVEAVFYQTGFTGHGREKAVLSGGNKVTVQVKPSP
jgi:hypothetical protein